MLGRSIQFMVRRIKLCELGFPCALFYGQPNRWVSISATTTKKSSAQRRVKPSKLVSSETDDIDADKLVEFTFLERLSGDKIKVSGNVGRSVLDVALDNNVDIEGACGGELACSTCHVIVADELYGKLPSKKIEEDDMLDLAQGLTKTSRLCCQLKVSSLLHGAVFTVPNDTM